MLYSQVNGTNFRYHAAGRGPDIVFIHGWGASGRMWLRAMHTLRREYRTWALDLPGHGASQGNWPGIEGTADSIAAFCQQKGIQGAIFVGHSMGARVTFDIARRYPQLVERIVAVSPAVTGRMGLSLDVFMAGKLGDTLLSLTQHVGLLADIGILTQFGDSRYINRECANRASGDLRRADRQAIEASLRSIVGQDYSPNLPQIYQPTLIIMGSRDYTIPPADAYHVAELLPDAEVVMLEGIHHMVSDERPRKFTYLVRDFAGKNNAVPTPVSA